MESDHGLILGILGCGNQGSSILDGVLSATTEKATGPQFNKFIACVRSHSSQQKLAERFAKHLDKLTISRENCVQTAQASDVIILGVNPADIGHVLQEPGFRDAVKDKLVISIAAGWSRKQLANALYGNDSQPPDTNNRACIVRTLPTITAQVCESITAIEISEPAIPEWYLQITDAIFQRIGLVLHVDPESMNPVAITGGATPAFFAVICDALIDAAVAVGVHRNLAQTIIFQSMQGTATMLKSGIHPALLKDQGTSPEGCTIGGLLVLEGGVRGNVSRALREAVTLSRLMERKQHINDTRE